MKHDLHTFEPYTTLMRIHLYTHLATYRLPPSFFFKEIFSISTVPCNLQRWPRVQESPPATEGGWENRLSFNYRGDLCLVALVKQAMVKSGRNWYTIPISQVGNVQHFLRSKMKADNFCLAVGVICLQTFFIGRLVTCSEGFLITFLFCWYGFVFFCTRLPTRWLQFWRLSLDG